MIGLKSRNNSKVIFPLPDMLQCCCSVQVPEGHSASGHSLFCAPRTLSFSLSDGRAQSLPSLGLGAPTPKAESLTKHHQEGKEKQN